MSTAFQIPLAQGPQSFAVPLGGATYRMRLWWGDSDEPAWYLDVATDADVPLVRGVPLLPGADLLSQHRHLGVAGELYVVADGPITYDSLGTSTRLYFVPTT